MSDRGTRMLSSWLPLALLLAATGCGDDDSGNHGADASIPDSGGGGSGGSHAGSGGSHAGTGGVQAGSGGSPAGSGGSHGGGGGVHGGSGGSMHPHDAGSSDEDAGPSGPSWAREVHPALVSGCGGCHGEPSDNDAGIVIGRPGGPGEGVGDAPGKFAVDDAHAAYDAIRPFVIPGDSAHSNLYIKISQDSPSTGGQRMPPALRQWDDPDIQLVRDWIEAGALED